VMVRDGHDGSFLASLESFSEGFLRTSRFLRGRPVNTGS
jgi:hypothetical protein